MTTTRKRTRSWRTSLCLLLELTTQLLRLPPLLRLLGEELSGLTSPLPSRRPRRPGRPRRLRKVNLRLSSQLRPSRLRPSQPRASRIHPSRLRTSQRPPSRLRLSQPSRFQRRPASRLATPPALISLTY
ncbi:hypothetical protein PR002_g14833 [Phytophthora rubi]|uniref:Uncharacterized protein n=1 Tax=Phytophthora rubi TaxID=129364 RepID=A0A6A3KY87_9STRA|nr:hypothetical protein PR002_g14833 [Phytophthora rubi]